MDEAKHIADAAPADPQAPAAAEAAFPAQPPGDAATRPPREPAGAPPQPSLADPGRDAAPEAAAIAPAGPGAEPAAPRGEAPEAAPEPLAAAEAQAPAGAELAPQGAAAEPEPPAVVVAATAAAPDPQAIEAAAAAAPEPVEEAAAAGASEPPAMAATATVEPEPPAAESAAVAEPGPRSAVEPPAAAAPDPQAMEGAAAAAPERVEGAPAAEPEPQAATVAEGEPPAVAAAAAEPEHEPARAHADPEPEPRAVAALAAPPEPRAEALQGRRGGEATALAALPSRTAAARTAPAWPRRALPAPAGRARHRAGRGYLAYVRLALIGIAALGTGFVALVLALVVLYRWVDPPTSTLMLGQRLAGTRIERRWVPLERMSPHLVKAVVLSEDGSFCRHRGVDWRALEEAIESARGGSTITMQVVKNLFLWPSRSYLRKAIEIALAYVVELIWPKRRILEIYLNIAEWGDGVFGAEAAAQLHFRKAAARLTAAEAALLAVALPNPGERDAGSPSPGMSRLATRLLVRMTASRASLACVRMGPRTHYGALHQAHLFGPGH